MILFSLSSSQNSSHCSVSLFVPEQTAHSNSNFISICYTVAPHSVSYKHFIEDRWFALYVNNCKQILERARISMEATYLPRRSTTMFRLFSFLNIRIRMHFFLNRKSDQNVAIHLISYNLRLICKELE